MKVTNAEPGLVSSPEVFFPFRQIALSVIQVEGVIAQPVWLQSCHLGCTQMDLTRSADFHKIMSTLLFFFAPLSKSGVISCPTTLK